MATARKVKSTTRSATDEKGRAAFVEHCREQEANAKALFIEWCKDGSIDPAKLEHVRESDVLTWHREANRLGLANFLFADNVPTDHSAVGRLTYKLTIAWIRRDESTEPFFARLESETGVQLGFREWAEWLLRRFVTSGRNPDAVAEIAVTDLAAMLGKVRSGQKRVAKKRGRPSTQAQRDAIKTEFDKGVTAGKWKTVPQFVKVSPQRKSNGKKYSTRYIQSIVNPDPQSKAQKRNQISQRN